MIITDINGIKRECQKVFPDPDYPGFIRIEFRRHHEWYTTQEFLKFNPTLKHLIKKAPKVPDEVVGIATAAGKDYVRDHKLALKSNTYLGFFCWIARGTGEGQKRIVVKNTKNTFYVDKPWDTKPDKTSQFVISHNIHEVRAFGNILPGEEALKIQEEFARKIDMERGIKPQVRQYTKKPKERN